MNILYLRGQFLYQTFLCLLQVLVFFFFILTCTWSVQLLSCGNMFSYVGIDVLTLFLLSFQTPVPSLKAKVASATGVPVELQRLIFRGKVLKDDHHLSDYRIHYLNFSLVSVCLFHIILHKLSAIHLDIVKAFPLIILELQIG